MAEMEKFPFPLMIVYKFTKSAKEKVKAGEETHSLIIQNAGNKEKKTFLKRLF